MGTGTITFASANYTHSVPENSPAGTLLVTVNATFRGKAIKYAMVGSSVTEMAFSVDSETGGIETLIELDAEEQSEYTFHVNASHGVRWATANVTIYVTDINEAPAFDHRSVSLVVDDVTPVGSAIAVLNATDPDVGDTITFTIVQLPRVLSVDPVSGVVALAKSLVADQDATYVAILYATDSGTPGLADSTRIYVTVRNANRHAPRFGRSNYTVSVAESAPLGSKLLSFSITDDDLAAAGEIASLEIFHTGGDSATLFEFEKNDQAVLLSGVLDREVKAVYAMVIVATDNGSPSRNTSVSFVVNVLDANDNAPVFADYGNSELLDVAAPIGYNLWAPPAFDTDEGVNASFQYYIPASSDGFDIFAYNATTGVLRVDSAISYSVGQHFVLDLRAEEELSLLKSMDEMTWNITIVASATCGSM